MMWKRVISAIMALCMLCTVFVPIGVYAIPEEDAPQLVVSTTEGAEGEAVEVSVSIENNPGVGVLTLGIDYDKTMLEYIGFENSGFTGWTVKTRAVWIGDEDSYYNGEILKLKFKAIDGVSGFARVTVVCNDGDAYNYAEEPVLFNIIPGGAEIRSDETDHECVPLVLFIGDEEYEWVRQWNEDEESGGLIDAGHCQICEICGRQLSEMEPHTYENGRCMLCGATDSTIGPDEPGEFVVSGTVSLGETLIDIPGGMAYYAFTPEEDGLYQFTSVGDDDAWGTLLNSEFMQIADDDDSGDEFNFGFTAELFEGATYYIGVKFYSENSGQMILSVSRHVHNFETGRCTCGAVDPSHECEPDERWHFNDDGHFKCCIVCGRWMSDPQPHTYDGNYCTVCGAVNPNHECVPGDWRREWDWDEESGEEIDGHVRTCAICGRQMGKIESHTYEGNYCTVCNAPNPNHECVAEEGWSYGEGYGHYKLCSICYRLVGEEYGHEFENDVCVVCGAPDPNHECVPSEWWYYNDGGHFKRCSICNRLIGTVEPHTYNNNHCTVCGAINPDHEHIASEDWQRYGHWDEEGQNWISTGHCRICTICYEPVSDIVPHTYVDNRCTVCGAPDPAHECVASEDWYPFCYEWDEEIQTEIDMGHCHLCAICDRQMSETEPHTYEDNYCTVCGAPDPNHECVPADWWGWDEETNGHYRVCEICYTRLGEVEPHTFAGNRCTVCNAPNPDHECVPADWMAYDADGHYRECAICYKQLSEVEPHTFEGNHCTKCGAVNPNHECVVADDVWVYGADGHNRGCAVCYKQLSEVEPHTFEGGRCTVCGMYDDNHVHNYIYSADSYNHQRNCSICGDNEEWEAHCFDANGVCTACGWIRDMGTVTDLAIRNGENKELILTLTYADGTTCDMTVTGSAGDFGVRLGNGWRETGGTTYTDKGTVCLNLCKNDDDGRFYAALLDENHNQIVSSNIMDKCEWYDAYCATWQEDITNPNCRYEDGVWKVTGTNYSGQPVCMTMDDAYHVLDYDIAGCEHIWDDGVITTPATCTTEGIRTYTCTECGAAKTEVIPAFYNVNGDSEINADDLSMLLRHVAKIEPLSEEQIVRADFNNDENVDAVDVTLLAKYLESIA